MKRFRLPLVATTGIIRFAASLSSPTNSASSSYARFLWQATSPVAKTEDPVYSAPDLFGKAIKEMFSETQSDLAMQSPDATDKCFGKRANRAESRLLFRQALSQKLDIDIADYSASLELANSAAADIDADTQTEPHNRLSVRRHILVREFATILRRLSVSSFSSADLTDMTESPDIVALADARCEAAVIVSAAWSHYLKIRMRSDAGTLIRQIPMPAICLLVTELAFMAGAKDYRRRFERIVQIFDDFVKYERPIRSPVQFAMYLRALNKLGRHQLVVRESNAYFAQQKDHTAIAPSLAMGVKRQAIIAYFKGNRPDSALAEFKSIKADQRYAASITPHVYSSFLSGALHSKTLPNITLYEYLEEMLSTVCQPSYPETSRTGLLNELLHTAHKADNADFFFYVFERSLACGIKLNYTSFGILLHFSFTTYATDARQLFQLYARIISSTPNREMMSAHIFAIFINSFVRMQRSDYALCALNDLREHPTAQLTPRHSFALFDHYAELGMAQNSLDLYHMMFDSDTLQVPWKVWMCIIRSVWNADASLVTYDSACEQQSQGDDRSLTMRERHDYLVVRIVNCGRAHDIRSMFGAFLKLHALFPTSIASFAMLFTTAHRIAERDAWRSGSSLQCAPSSQVTSLATDDSWIYSLVEHLRTAANYLVRSSSQLPIPQELYSRAISTFAMLHDYQSAQMLYNHIVTVESMEPTADTFGLLMRAFVDGSDMKMATDTLSQARKNKVPITALTANALIHGYFATNQPEQALMIYSYIAGRPLPLHENPGYTGLIANAPVDIHTYTMLVLRLVECGYIKEAIIVFDDAFTLLRQVPNRLLSMLVAGLEERMQFDTAQLCLRRYYKKVDHGDSESSSLTDTFATAVSEARLPVSYFETLVDQEDHSENRQGRRY
ncbi:hypothetical protein H4S06_000227 [Coemansia sp. BCRC 34490]|nr:hypothetical protein H4S06_000227 [Coemansia sp. BCRC 34490]